MFKYVYAHFLQSYKEKKAMILTQMPLANTKDDFWALIQQQEVHTIVMLNNVIEAEVCVAVLGNDTRIYNILLPRQKE